jgi:hypothetical protein
MPPETYSARGGPRIPDRAVRYEDDDLTRCRNAFAWLADHLTRPEQDGYSNGYSPSALEALHELVLSVASQ